MSRRSRGPPKLPVSQLAILEWLRRLWPRHIEKTIRFKPHNTSLQLLTENSGMSVRRTSDVNFNLSISSKHSMRLKLLITTPNTFQPEMIENFGVEKKDVAKWAGITSAVFSLSQCLTAVPWGRASDKIGRKPAILTGLIFTLVFTVMWGLATSLPLAIAVRALTGACNGNVGIIRTMVAEMVPEKELQPRAFSIMPLVWSLGSIFGPSFGGFFAKPTENLHGIFGDNKFLEKYPFALPNLIAALFFVIGIITGILFLKETLETKRHKTDYGLVAGQQLINIVKTIFGRPTSPRKGLRTHLDEETSASLLRPTSSSSHDHPHDFHAKSKEPKAAPSVWEVFSKQSVINLVAYTFLALHAVAYDQLLPIFLHTPRQTPDEHNTQLPFKFSGGFGLKSSRIGTLFTLYGLCGCFIQFLIFPPMARKYGVLNCFKACGAIFPIVYFVTPYTALIQDETLQQIVLFGTMIVKCFAGIFAFPCSIILLTNSSPSLLHLGTLNGIAVSVSGLGRALGPALSGATFTLGLRHGYVIPAWWLLGCLAAIGSIPVWFLVEGEGFASADTDSEDEDEDEDEALLPEITEEDGEEVGTILAGDEIFLDRSGGGVGGVDPNEEALDVVEGPPLSNVKNRRTRSMGRRVSADREDVSRERELRISSPIGMRESVGPGGGRRLSNGLAASNFGQGTGGTSFT